MKVQSLIRALVGIVLLACLPGCFVSVGSTRNPYDNCTSGDTCAGYTACQNANTTTNPGATVGGPFCTTSCVLSSDCPSDASGYLVVCVSTAAAGGQCYRACASGNLCPGGFTCGGPAGQAPFCVPNG